MEDHLRAVPATSAEEADLARHVRRRDRRRRNRRIQAAVVSLLVVLTGFGVALRVLDRAERRTPAGPAITPSNVGRLELQWRAKVSSPGAGHTPVVTDGVVVVGSDWGQVRAFPEHCGSGGETCRPLWTADVGKPYGGSVSAADGWVYAADRGGSVAAYPIDCRRDGGTCAPAWTARVPSTPGVPFATGDVVLVPTIGGDLFAFRVACGTGGATCEPIWSARLGGSGLGHLPPVPAGDVVYVTGLDERLYAVDLASGRTRWVGGPTSIPSASVKGWGSVSAPLPVGDTVYAMLYNTLYAFPVSCTGGCVPRWTAPIEHANAGSPVIVGDHVIVFWHDRGAGGFDVFDARCRADGGVCRPANTVAISVEPRPGAGLWPLEGGSLLAWASDHLYAFDVTCLLSRPACPASWVRDDTAGPRAQRGSLLFISGPRGLEAFDSSCLDPGSCGPPLWTSGGPGWLYGLAPLVTEDQVLLVTGDGWLEAYGVPTGGR